MKDIIEIKKNKVIVQISFTVKKSDTAFIGYIPSFDIPFTSPTEEKASEIAGGLIRTLFNRWLTTGKIEFLKKKLEKFKFAPQFQSDESRFEHTAPEESIRIPEEVYVV